MTVRIEALSPVRPGNHTLVVFPHAGGSPRFFVPWCRQLPASIDLYGVTYPGRDALLDEPAPQTLVELAGQCASALAPVIGAGTSAALLGHSMGSLVAFETLRSLQRSQLPVAALVASGSDAPHLGDQRCWHRAGDDDLVCHLGDLDPRSREVLAVPELRRLLLPTIRDDLRLVETYRAEPHPPIASPILVINGESDPEVSPAGAAGWAQHTRAGSQMRWLPGDHLYLRHRGAQVVAEVSAFLGGAARAGGSARRVEDGPELVE
jgi:pyochelin biosynthetic protein PchC